MDGFEGEVGFELVGLEVRGKVGGMGGDLFFDAWEGIGGDGKSATGQERVKGGGWVDLGWCVEFPHGVESSEDVASASIRENTEKRSVGIVVGDGAGATDR